MVRACLDPGTAEPVNRSIVVERVPEAVRKFGRYPDLDVLQPGDLILVSPVKRGFNAKLIAGAQSAVHAPFDAQWIHAATYLGDNSLVEIDGGGVRVEDLHRYVPTHRLLFRRVKSLSGNPVDELTGYRIAVSALKAFKTRYAHFDLLPFARAALARGRPDHRIRPRDPAAICSTYFNDAVAQVLGRGAVSAKRNPFSPADLSASTNMLDLAVDWVGIPP